MAERLYNGDVVNVCDVMELPRIHGYAAKQSRGLLIRSFVAKFLELEAETVDFDLHWTASTQKMTSPPGA